MSETTLHEVCAAGELCDLIAQARRSSIVARWFQSYRVYRLTLIVQKPLLSSANPARTTRSARTARSVEILCRTHLIAARTALLFCLPRKLCRLIAGRLPTSTWP